MKNKKIHLIAICLLFACSTFAGINRSSTDNWLKKTDGNSLRASKPNTDTDIGDPSTDPGVGSPIGDALWLVVGLGFVYGSFILIRKKTFN